MHILLFLINFANRNINHYKTNNKLNTTTMRKPAIKKVISISEKIDALVEKLNEIIEAEQEAFDEHSELWQESEAGEEFSERIYAAEELRDALENAAYDIQSTLEY